MKKSILLLSVVFFIGCSAQKRKILIDPPLLETVNEFINEAEMYGIDTKVLSKTIDYIVIMPLHPNLYGVFVPRTRQVMINGFVLDDEYILKKVVYHELGHVLGLDHDRNGIMATGLGPKQIHNKYCPDDNESGFENWEIHKIVLFRKILEKQKK